MESFRIRGTGMWCTNTFTYLYTSRLHLPLLCLCLNYIYLLDLLCLLFLTLLRRPFRLTKIILLIILNSLHVCLLICLISLHIFILSFLFGSFQILFWVHQISDIFMIPFFLKLLLRRIEDQRNSTLCNCFFLNRFCFFGFRFFRSNFFFFH